MTVNAFNNKVTFTGGLSQSVFPFSFRILQDADLRVYLTKASDGSQVLLSDLTDYTITGALSYTGGNVTLVATGAAGATLATGYTLTLFNSPVPLQTTQFQAGATYDPAVVETDLDHATIVDQAQGDDLGRAIRAPVQDVPMTALPPAALRAGKTLVFDGSGNPSTGSIPFGTVVISAAITPVVTAASTALARVAMGPFLLADLQTITTARILGNISGSPAVPVQLTGPQVATLIPAVSAGVAGLVPGPTGGDAKKPFLATGAFADLPWLGAISDDSFNTISAAGGFSSGSFYFVGGTATNYQIDIPLASPAKQAIAFAVDTFANASQVYTLVAGGSLIDGKTSMALVAGNRVFLYSDGTSWWSLAKFLDTPWIDGGALVITGTSSNPTKPTTPPSPDRLLWRRVGDSLQGKGEYFYASAAGAAAGGGNYNITLPFTVDTTRASASTATNHNYGQTMCGMGTLTNTGSSDETMTMYLYDSTKIRGWMYNVGFWGASHFPLNNGGGFGVGFNFTLPIVGW